MMSILHLLAYVIGVYNHIYRLYTLDIHRDIMSTPFSVFIMNWK